MIVSVSFMCVCERIPENFNLKKEEKRKISKKIWDFMTYSMPKDHNEIDVIEVCVCVLLRVSRLILYSRMSTNHFSFRQERALSNSTQTKSKIMVEFVSAFSLSLSLGTQLWGRKT